MTKYIDNINCALHLCDTENEEWSVQIANYGLSPLVVINEILATRNKEKITQKLLLQLCKESEPNISSKNKRIMIYLQRNPKNV